MSELTTISNCHNLDDALRLKMILEAAGIASFIPDEFSAGAAPHHFSTPSGVRLQVPAADAERAVELLHARNSED